MMFLKTFCALAILAFSFANADTKVSIKRGEEEITTYTEPLSKDKVPFECVAEGAVPKSFDWYIGDQKEHSSISSSPTAFWARKLDAKKHYKKKLKCTVTFEDDSTKSVEVELLMTCKLYVYAIRYFICVPNSL